MTIIEEKPVNLGRRKATFWQVTKSVLWGALGVQKSQRQAEDFSSDSALPFIIGGLVFTGFFVGILVVIVSFVVP